MPLPYLIHGEVGDGFKFCAGILVSRRTNTGFLMADAVTCALPNQNTPNGYYNIERMLKSVLFLISHSHTCFAVMQLCGFAVCQGKERGALSKGQETQDEGGVSKEYLLSGIFSIL